MPCRGSYSGQDFFEAATDQAEIVKSLGNHHFIRFRWDKCDKVEYQKYINMHMQTLASLLNEAASHSTPAVSLHASKSCKSSPEIKEALVNQPLHMLADHPAGVQRKINQQKPLGPVSDGRLPAAETLLLVKQQSDLL